MAKQVKLEKLSSEQRERVFLEYAWQEDSKEFAKLSPSDQSDFQRLVSEKQRELLIQARVDRLKFAYKKRLTQPRLKPADKHPNRLARIKKINKQDVNQERIGQSSLAKEYLEFRKKESAKNEYNLKESEKDFLGTKPPKSPQKFELWYYAGTASEEMCLRMGIYPPTVRTPAGAVWQSQYTAYTKTMKAERIIEQKESQLRESGVKVTPKKSVAIRKEAYDEVGKEWQKEKEEALKRWLESKDLKSVQSFSNQVDEHRGKKDLSSLSLQERAAYFQQKYGSKEPEQSQSKQWEKSI